MVPGVTLDGPDVKDEADRRPLSRGQSIPSEKRKSAGRSYQRGRRSLGLMPARLYDIQLSTRAAV
jgi:hypothetical protein